MKKTVVLSFPTSCFIQVKHPIYIRKEETMEVSHQEKRPGLYDPGLNMITVELALW